MIILRSKVLLPLVHSLKRGHGLRTCLGCVHLRTRLRQPHIFTSQALRLVARSSLLQCSMLLTVSLHHFSAGGLGNAMYARRTAAVACVLMRLIHVLLDVGLDLWIEEALLGELPCA